MSKPKVLFFDIETSPNLGYTWEKYEQNVISFKKEWTLLAFAYKWLGGSEVQCASRRKFSEKELVKSLWQLFDAADILVAHNGNSFDIKKVKAKFVQYGLKPPSPFKSIDTKVIAARQFKFNSNSLNDLAKLLKLGSKIDTGGFDLWIKCMAGDKEAFLAMEKYNRHDVVLLEKVYEKLKAWNPNPPKVVEDRGQCPACESTRTQMRGTQISGKGRVERLQCQDCGKWFKGKKVKQ